MNKTIYDIIIIGAGSGGLNVAGFFSRLNLRVLLIDKSDSHIGGDCLNTGCIPSKALIHVANQIHEGRLSRRFLTDGAEPSIDIKKVIAYITSKQDIIRQNENPEYLKNKGIDYKSGEARFVDEHTITCNGELYTAKNFVLATGSRARSLSIENDKSLREFTNETIFSIDFLPKHFIFIGGGPINCELGQAFSRLGSKVTILNSGKRILEKELPLVSEMLRTTFEGEGITVVSTVRISKIVDKKVFYTVDGDDTMFELEGDAVFVGIGRELNIEELDLEKGGVKTNESKTKLIVDEYLRTTNPHVYVVGDVASNYQFTHAAEMHAKVVISNLLSPFKQKFSGESIAWVTYTTPEVATFGCSQEEATSKGFEILSKDFTHEDRAIVDENEGKLMLYVDSKSVIRGGTMIAKNAGELSQELILAMSAKLTLSQIFAKVYPYPTGGRIVKQLVGEKMSEKLTESTKKILRFLYTLFS